MHRTNILGRDSDVVDRLRVHAARMTEDTATALHGYGFSTEKWEREDLLHLLDEAADIIERLRD